MLQLEHISKKIGNFHLEDISLELPPGYIMGLIGPNGAGKTTLLHLILGLYRPGEGTLRIAGREYEEAEQEIREMTGSVLLDELFVPGFSLKENATLYGKYYKKYSYSILEDYLHRFGLNPRSLYRRLSRGEKLKFQFAFALSHAPKLLVLDEPTGNFDPDFREEFWEILKNFIADGEKSVILSTHLTEDLDRMADYITYLDKGKLLVSTDIESLRDSYRLVTGETYKIRLLPAESMVYMEEGSYGTRALVRHHRRYKYDAALTVTQPTIEELMYFQTKGGKRV
ncbi:MAG: ABC transporter ATP-binding protein [Roseburia sp.]